MKPRVNQWKRPRLLIPLMCLFLSVVGCEKDWLEAKRDLNTVLPKSLADLEALLNSHTVMGMTHDYVGMLTIADDDYYVELNLLRSFGDFEYNMYTWSSFIYPTLDRTVTEWNNSYEQVLHANVVLEKLEQIPRDFRNANHWDNIKGSALFFRAKAFFNLARCFVAPRDGHATKGETLGIPLRLTPDPNPVSTRSTWSETYDRITGDLKLAAGLLSEKIETKLNPSKQAAYGLLARVYLSIGEYEQASSFADSCLAIHSQLMDYKTIPVGTDNTFPFPEFNDEVIFHGYLMPQYLAPHPSMGRTDTVLLSQYQEHDLRRSLFFRSNTGFRGNYTGNGFKFGGISTNEILLIRAEGLARASKSQLALEDLNKLLLHRYADGQFTPYTGLHGKELLELILQERRKELLHRGLRWGDLRRLNQEPAHSRNLVRLLETNRYELPPGDPRYTMPIPDVVIKATGMPQNERN